MLWAHPHADRAGPPWLAVSLLSMSAVAILVAHGAGDPITDEPGAIEHESEGRSMEPWRWWTFTAALLVSGTALVLLPRAVPDQPRGLLVILWLASIAGTVVALGVGRRSERSSGDVVPPVSRRTLVIAVAITALAALVRLPALGSIPFTLAGDEASQGLEAVRTLTGDIVDPFSTGWLGVPTMSFFANSPSIGVLGQTVAALRLPWALVGLATVPVTFWLARRMGNEVGLICAGLVATYHVHVHFSRLGSNQIADPLFVAVTMLLVLRGLERGRALDWVGAGCVMGLAAYFYAGARLTPVVVVVVLLQRFASERRDFSRHLPGIAAMVAGASVVAAPMLQFAIRFPDDFNARLNEVGVFQSGWLSREVIIRGESTASILGDQVVRAAFGFIHYPDRTVWYGLPEPLLHPLVGGLSVVGLVICTWWSLRPGASPVIVAMSAWWWLGVMAAGALTVPTPSSQRLVTVAVPTCFMIAVAVRELTRALPKTPVTASIPVVAAIVFAVISLHTYFVEHMPRRVYGGPHAELATTIAPELAERAHTHYVHFVAAPAMYWNFATIPYLVPDAIGGDVVEELRSPAAVYALTSDHGDERSGLFFVVLDGRLDELRSIEEAWPGGRREEVFSGADGRLMAITYDVEPQD
jgi:hypothetical protein